MKLIKRHKTILCGMLAFVLLMVLIFLIAKADPVLECFHKNPDMFITAANNLCSNLPDDFPLLLNRNDNIQETTVSPMPSDVASAIEYIFSASECDMIFVSRTSQGTPFCQFTSHGRDTVKGIAFIGNNPDSGTLDSIFFGLLVRECTIIDDEWVYFEYLTTEGEKETYG